MEIKKVNISLIRGIAMIMIILCHIFQYFDNELAWWFNVGVQIFLFMSGFLYGQKEIIKYIDWYKQRLLRLLKPYYIYILMVSLFYFIFARDLFSVSALIRNGLCIQYFTGGISGLEHLWFVSFIIICYLITPILQSVYKNILQNKNEFSFIISLVGIAMFLQLLAFIGAIRISVPNLLCYIGGYLVSRRYFNKNYKRENDKIDLKFLTISSTALALISNGVIIYYRYYLFVPGLRGGNIIFDYAHAMLGISIFFILFKLFDLNSNSKFVQYTINFVDKYSFDMYIVHQIYILGRFSLMNFTNSIALNVMLIFGVTILSGMILNKIAKVLRFRNESNITRIVGNKLIKN